MRRAALLLGLLTACGGGTATGPAPDEPQAHAQLADDDAFRPTYSKADLEKALIAERGAEATGERQVADLQAKSDGAPGATDAMTMDALRVARADLAVRQRFITSLEACQSQGRWCPPRLDDPPWAFDPDPDPGKASTPPLTTAVRFDLDDWQKVSAELHGRACACRTISCVDSVGVAIDQLEPRPMADVRGDETATISLTRARECLFRLRGKDVRATLRAEE